MDIPEFWVIVCCEDGCEYFDVHKNLEEARSIANEHRNTMKHSLKMVPIEGKVVTGNVKSHE